MGAGPSALRGVAECKQRLGGPVSAVAVAFLVLKPSQ